MRRAITRDLAASMLRHLTSVIAGLFTVGLIARHLGVESLAAWALLGSVGALFGLADAGIATPIYRAGGVADHARVRSVVSLALLAVLAVAPLVALLAATLLLDLPGASAGTARDLARAAPLAIGSGILQALTSPFSALVLVRGAFPTLTFARIVAAVLQLGCIAIGMAISPSLVAPALGLFLGSLAQLALVIAKARQLDPEVPLWPRLRFNLGEVVSIAREGAASLAIGAATTAGLRLDVYLLAHAAPVEVVAAYGIASRAVDQCYVLAKQGSVALVPRLGEKRSRERAVVLGAALLGGLVAAGMPALALDGGALLRAWAGPAAIAPAAALALLLLGSAAVLAALGEMPANALSFGGPNPWQAALPIISGAALNVIVSVVGASHFTVVAVAGGTVLGNALTAILLWRRANKVFGWPADRPLRAVAPAAAAAVAAIACGLALGPLAARSPLASLLACAATLVTGALAALAVASRTVPGAAGAEVGLATTASPEAT